MPKNWIELKELCKKYEQKGIIKDCSFGANFIIKSREPLTFYEHICINSIYFAENGDIFAGFEPDCIATNRTPPQMWNIIISLAEEE